MTLSTLQSSPIKPPVKNAIQRHARQDVSRSLASVKFGRLQPANGSSLDTVNALFPPSPDLKTQLTTGAAAAGTNVLKTVVAIMVVSIPAAFLLLAGKAEKSTEKALENATHNPTSNPPSATRDQEINQNSPPVHSSNGSKPESSISSPDSPSPSSEEPQTEFHSAERLESTEPATDKHPIPPLSPSDAKSVNNKNSIQNPYSTRPTRSPDPNKSKRPDPGSNQSSEYKKPDSAKLKGQKEKLEREVLKIERLSTNKLEVDNRIEEALKSSPAVQHTDSLCNNAISTLIMSQKLYPAQKTIFGSESPRDIFYDQLHKLIDATETDESGTKTGLRTALLAACVNRDQKDILPKLLKHYNAQISVDVLSNARNQASISRPVHNGASRIDHAGSRILSFLDYAAAAGNTAAIEHLLFAFVDKKVEREDLLPIVPELIEFARDENTKKYIPQHFPSV